MARTALSRRLWLCFSLLLAVPVTAAVLFIRPSVGQEKAVAPSAQPAPANVASYPTPENWQNIHLMQQTAEDAAVKSTTCISCHENSKDPHFKETVRLGCTDCHGGNAGCADKEGSHVQPRFPEAWRSSANPIRSYTLLNHESPEYIRFRNPSDLRVAHLGCGTTDCHPKEVLQNRKSMMTHGAMLWEAAAYNNGTVPIKVAVFGESYSMNGVGQRIQTNPKPTDEDGKHGVLGTLDPLPRFEIIQPANVFRIFERGGRFIPVVGIPESDDDPGKPRTRLSVRGLGTQNRTDPGGVTLLKTRLLDPTLNMIGTNDHAGDYRNSGCSACHVIYANDRSPVHSGFYAKYGNQGLSASSDPAIPKNEKGHPIDHKFAPGNGIPTSQCIVCHIHPGTTVMNSYTGFMWWDEETDGELLYPKEEKHPTAEEFVRSQMSNPNESSAKGLWSDPEFLERVSELNPQCKHTQFADYHGHGWIFRAVFKQDRKGQLLDKKGNVIPEVTNAQLQAAMNPDTRGQDGVPVHLLDIHLEKGMHCIDCHFIQDNHGNLKLQGEVRAAIEIQCIDCHGTPSARPTLLTTGPAAYTSSLDGKGRNLATLRNPEGKRRFERVGDKLYQNGMVPNKDGKYDRWEVVQVVDTITPGAEHYNPKSHLAKTVRFSPEGKMVWGDMPADPSQCAHYNKNMTCIACHSSWNPSCYGCHLPQKANMKTPELHYEGDVLKNFVSYNFQTLRDDIFMIGRDGDVTGNRINPCRSSCAIHVTSYNGVREGIYNQQQTISGDGLSGIAFSSNVPHTVRGKGETKMCTDCHLSVANDNNAIMAQLLMQGTGYMNFMGEYCWVAGGEHGLFGVEVTERDEPQAVIGSTLHELAFPEHYEEHLKHHKMLEHAHEHPGKDISEQILNPFKPVDIHNVQVRGEYVLAACGEYGMRAFDVAFINDKAFSERITSAPVSPLGQQFYVRTKNAMYVALPSTLTPDPTRTQHAMNKEPKIHPIFCYAFIADKCEGVILVNVNTTINGNPTDNFLHRELTYNPDGLLDGAHFITFHGTYAYVCCNAGLVVIDFDKPLEPKVTAVLGKEWLKHPKMVATQFRYAFVCEEEGLAVLDITDPAQPRAVAGLKLKEAESVYVGRTYAYVAAGKEGLVIVDIENPEKPKIDQVFTADGCINDCHDVKLAVTYVSMFAYLADGKNGLRVVQLTSPDTPGNYGFSPRPTPQLVATYKIPKGGHALNVSRALDRDRAVDESGNQIAVFGRIGARPFNLAEQMKMFIRNGALWRVSDDTGNPVYLYRREQKPGEPGGN